MRMFDSLDSGLMRPRSSRGPGRRIVRANRGNATAYRATCDARARVSSDARGRCASCGSNDSSVACLAGARYKPRDLADPRRLVHYPGNRALFAATAHLHREAHRMPLVDPVIERVLADFERRAEEEQRRTIGARRPRHQSRRPAAVGGTRSRHPALSTCHRRAVAAHPRARHVVWLFHRVAGARPRAPRAARCCRSSCGISRSSMRARR